MNDLPNAVSRYMAPFGLGMSMAAVAAAEDLLTGAALAALSCLFALLCAVPGRRMPARLVSAMSALRGVSPLVSVAPASGRGSP